MANIVLTQQETDRLINSREEKLSRRKYQRGKKAIKYRSKWDIYADILKHLKEFQISGIKGLKYGSYMDGGYSSTKKWISYMHDTGLIEIAIVPRFTRDKMNLINRIRAADTGVNHIRYPFMIISMTDKGRAFLDLYQRLAELLA